MGCGCGGSGKKARPVRGRSRNIKTTNTRVLPKSKKKPNITILSAGNVAGGMSKERRSIERMRRETLQKNFNK